jgi:glycine/D-amino acid oxidase-like deaminating enzyme
MARLRYGLPLWLDRVPVTKRPSFPRFKASATVEAEVVIVGGGLAGAMCAYLFAQAGAKVILLEAARVGQGSATGSGWSPETPGMPFRAMQAAYGLRAARRVWDATRLASLEATALLKRLKIKADVEKADTALFTRDTEQDRALRREHQAIADAGLDAGWLIGRRAATETKVDGAILGAMKTHGGVLCDPYRVTLGLLAAAAKAGAQLHEQSAVTKVTFNRKRAHIRTAHGVLDARAVVMATNEPGPGCAALHRHVRAADSYIVATPPLDGALARAFAAPGTVLRDAIEPPHTLRHTSDGRILFQGAAQPPVPARQQEKAVVQRTGQLMYELSCLYPAISGVMPAYGWSTRLATGLDGLPLAGPHRNFPHHLFAIGLGHAGLGGAYLAARILLRSFQETPEPADEHFGFSRLPR